VSKKTLCIAFLFIASFTFSQSINAYLNKAKNDVARGEYYQAAANYEAALKIDSLNPKANLEYGLLNTQYINNPANAGVYLLRSEKLSSKDTLSEVILGLAQYYQSTGQYQKAVKYYQRVYTRIEKGSEKVALENMLHQSISSCEYAASPPTQQAEFKRMKVVNAGSGVNSIYPEHSPVIIKDGSVLLFTSRRPSNMGHKIDDADGNYYEDMFIARRDKDKTFKNAHGFSNDDPEVKGLRNTKEHDAAVILSKNGDKFFTCHDNKIYESTWQNNEWTAPALMNATINPAGAYQSHLTMSADGKMIYFSSQREGGFGGLDIYKCDIQADGSWGVPVNLGVTINTKEDDDSPFLSYDGQTLYFASKGHPGYGAYDLYRSKWDGIAWSKPENMGALFNSSSDDTHLAFNKDETSGVFSSARAGGFGDMDIYEIQPEDPFENFVVDARGRINISVPDTLFLGEKVTFGASSNKLPPSAFQRYYWQVNDSVLNTNGETAAYTFSKPGEVRIRLAGISTGNEVIGYEKKVIVAQHKTTIVATNSTVTTQTTGNTTNTVTTGGRSGLDNVYFGFNKNIINTEARAVLLHNLKILADNPNMTITVAAYCDSRGSAKYNETLSEKRARNVVWYLCRHGLNKNRIKQVSWFGEKDPLNNCADGTPCTAGQYKINRRVEFKISAR
jgi:outer membrane protein OmpA-like peptidoglycan-associated protein/tetratricopeptide (TPR) repeat protein